MSHQLAESRPRSMRIIHQLTQPRAPSVPMSRLFPRPCRVDHGEMVDGRSVARQQACTGCRLCRTRGSRGRRANRRRAQATEERRAAYLAVTPIHGRRCVFPSRFFRPSDRVEKRRGSHRQRQRRGRLLHEPAPPRERRSAVPPARARRSRSSEQEVAVRTSARQSRAAQPECARRPRPILLDPARRWWFCNGLSALRNPAVRWRARQMDGSAPVSLCRVHGTRAWRGSVDLTTRGSTPDRR